MCTALRGDRNKDSSPVEVVQYKLSLLVFLPEFKLQICAMLPCLGEEPPEECFKLSHHMVDRLLQISGKVEGLDCILVDDMVDTGSTVRLALEILESHGAG